MTPTSAEISDDLSCLRCGYNLRTLSVTGRCPECGLAVKLSFSKRALAALDPAWLVALHRGSQWTSRAVFATLYLSLAISLVIHLCGGNGPIGLLLALFIAIESALWGIWNFSAAPAALFLPDRARHAARIARWMSGLTMVATAAACASIPFLKGNENLIALAVLASPFGLPGGVGAIAFCIYCRSVAKFSGHEMAYEKARSYGIGYAVGSILTVPSLATMSAYGAGSGPWCTLVPGMCVELLFGPFILSLPIMLEGRLSRIRRVADRIWKRHESPDSLWLTHVSGWANDKRVALR